MQWTCEIYQNASHVYRQGEAERTADPRGVIGIAPRVVDARANPFSHMIASTLSAPMANRRRRRYDTGNTPTYTRATRIQVHSIYNAHARVLNIYSPVMSSNYPPLTQANEKGVRVCAVSAVLGYMVYIERTRDCVNQTLTLCWLKCAGTLTHTHKKNHTKKTYIYVGPESGRRAETLSTLHIRSEYSAHHAFVHTELLDSIIAQMVLAGRAATAAAARSVVLRGSYGAVWYASLCSLNFDAQHLAGS